MTESVKGLDMLISQPLLVEPIYSPVQKFPIEQDFCQLQIDQLIAQLPLIAVWMIYQDTNGEGRKSAVCSLNTHPGFVLDRFTYLQSEIWLSDPWVALTLNKLPLEAGIHGYVCPLGPRMVAPEYVLVWASEPLSVLQQQGVEHQARLLRHHLDMRQECDRQREEIQLLEQAMRRAEHQLRNPIALIELLAETLALKLPESSWQEQAAAICEATQDLSANLKHLMSYGQQAKLQITQHDLRDILTESIKGLQPWLEQKQLRVQYPELPLTLAVDRWQMKQVLSNLLSNAIHFSPVGATIECSWQVFRHEALIEVRDRGSGLSEEDLQQLFIPFYSRRPGGSGLGLAIAKKIILDHRGRLWAQNLPSGGTQFSIILPRSGKDFSPFK